MGSPIDIEVYDDDFGKDSSEGSYSLTLDEAINDLVVEGKWYNLEGCKTGKIFISTIYVSKDDEEQVGSVLKEISTIAQEITYTQEKEEIADVISKPDDNKIEAGVLKIIIHKASQLENLDIVGKSDPFVKIKFNELEFKSDSV